MPKRRLNDWVGRVWDPSLIASGVWILRRADSVAALRLIRAGWGNPSWAVEVDYLRYLMTILRVDRPRRVLECGTGLTTVVLGSLAHRHEFTVVSLEHD